MKTVKLISIALAGALLVLSACKKDSDKESKGPEGPGGETVTDACGNTYPVVKIGKQYWMAENLKCDKYATESEAYNASWLTNNTITTTSRTDVYTPYYTDASDKSKWWSTSKTGNLTDTQVKKLGYLYNWAAAVGVADGDKQATAFSGNRQGICPNGWHVPTRAEWQTLTDYIDKADGRGIGIAGKHLKTISGWYNGDSDYKPCLDTYGFSALPAGNAKGSSVYFVGSNTFFWTATPFESHSGYAYGKGLYYHNIYVGDYDYSKSNGLSMRCLRN